jgi:hypothetical protein
MEDRIAKIDFLPAIAGAPQFRNDPTSCGPLREPYNSPTSCRT